MKWLLGGVAAYLAYRWWQSQQQAAAPVMQPLDGQGFPLPFSTGGGGGGEVSPWPVDPGAFTKPAPQPLPPVPAPPPPMPIPSPSGGAPGDGGGAPVSSTTPIPSRSDTSPIFHPIISAGTAAFRDPYHVAQASQTRGVGGIGRI